MKPLFYTVQPEIFEAIFEALADQELHRKVLARISERAQAIEVDIEKI